MKSNEVISTLRQFTQNNCNTTLDPKLCEHIRYLCDEVERLEIEMQRTTEYMDEDYITIQRYRSKLEKCERRLNDYEPF